MTSTAQWPGQPTDNTPYPAGYASITVAMDAEGIANQKTTNDKYYYSPQAMDREFDIERGDLVWTLTSHKKGGMFGIPKARTSFNGLTGIPGNCGKLEDIKEKLSHHADAYIQDLVSSHIQILGVAFVDHRFDRERSNAMASFAVQIAGIVQLLAHDYMPIGALAKAEPPQPSDWMSSGFKRRRGTDPGKIPLMVTAVHPEDSSNFALRVVYRYIHMAKSQTLDPLMDAVGDGRVQAEYQFASAMANFALVSGVLFLKECMRYDLVAPAPINETYDPQPGVGRPGGADAFHKDEYRNFESSVRVRESRKQKATADRGETRHGLGHLLWYAGGGGAPVQYPIQDLTPAAQLNAARPLLPEEAAVVVAKGVGVFGPVNASQTSSRSFNVEDRAPRRGEWMSSLLANNPTLEPERKSFRQLSDSFLKSVFISQHHDQMARNTRIFEFGNLDYANPDAQEHSGRQQSSSAGFVHNVDRRTLTGMLLSKQVNALFDLMNGMQNVYNVFRGRIVGRVTKSAAPGRMCEVQLNKAI
jgi:hypothetical protein